MAAVGAWWRWARQWRQNQLVETTDRIAVLEHVHDGGRLGPRYAFMIVMSCGIAMLGLLQDSAAVIIGAMLISPLMGPIIQLGMGLATFELRSIREALLSLLAGVALTLATAMLIVWLSPLKEATGEILARTRPTFFDLLVAVFSGLAGAYATVTRKGETIVGVAIATALMPPLAVTGYGLAVMNLDIAGGAAFLFMTNLLAIALSVTIVARWYGFGGSDSPKQSVWQAALIVGSFVLLSIPLGLALQRIGLQAQSELTVRATLDAAAEGASGRVSALRVDATATELSVDAVMLLPSHVGGLEASLQRMLTAQLGRPVLVRLREVLTADDATVARQQGTLSELRRSVAALQDAENVRGARLRALDEEEAGMRAALLPHLGRLQRSGDGRRWQLLLAPELAIPLARAQRIESTFNAGRTQEQAALEVYPVLQVLPPIPLIPDTDADADVESAAATETAAKEDGPGPAQEQALAAQVWALQRWRAGQVAAVLVTRDDARAAAWERALRETLSARGLVLDELQRERRGDERLQLAPAAP